MVKGCKNYFTMYGMLAFSINVQLHQFLTSMLEYMDKYTFIIINLQNSKFQTFLHKNQIYQKGYNHG